MRKNNVHFQEIKNGVRGVCQESNDTECVARQLATL